MSEIQSNIFVGTVVVEDGKVLMIREGKNTYGQRGTWNFPAGHAEYGEGLIEAAGATPVYQGTCRADAPSICVGR